MISGRLTIRSNAGNRLSGLLLLGASLTLNAAGDPGDAIATPKAILGLMAQQNPTRLNYKEIRSLKALHDPMVSTGTLEFAPPDRLTKQVESLSLIHI